MSFASLAALQRGELGVAPLHKSVLYNTSHQVLLMMRIKTIKTMTMTMTMTDFCSACPRKLPTHWSKPSSNTNAQPELTKVTMTMMMIINHDHHHHTQMEFSKVTITMIVIIYILTKVLLLLTMAS